MSYKIFLDDERLPDWVYKNTNNNDWVIIRNLTDFRNTIETRGIPDFISFDNDLGASMEEGKDAVKWMVDKKELDISNMDFNVHSANSGGPGGTKGYIASLLNNWKKELKRRKEENKNKKSLRMEVRRILENSLTQNTEKDKLVSILNVLPFKDAILSAGGEIYAVGGIVRDALLGRQSDDLDIVVRGIPYENLYKILSRFGKPTDTSVEDEDGKKDFGATKFVASSIEFNQLLSSNGIRRDIDVMLPRKDMKEVGVKGHRSIKSDVNPMYTIQDDLDRRDITINAIALDVHGNLISAKHALEDLKNGVIRAVSEEAFIEDPLRMVRAIRFAGKFNYKWDDKTLELIRQNAHLLSDKAELPRERFLMEFQKMIGKADLNRAVKLLVDLGLYKAMFGIESKIKDFNHFERAKNVAEFSYMLFEFEPAGNIINLVSKNITNTTIDLKYIEALIKYIHQVKGKNLGFIKEINELSVLYNLSPAMLLESSFVENQHRDIALKFKNGSLPKGEHDISLKGDELKSFIIKTFEESNLEFKPSDLSKMGKAKKFAVQAIYSNTIPNKTDAIKNYLLANKESWMF